MGGCTRVRIYTASSGSIVHVSKFIVPLFFLVYKGEAGNTILMFENEVGAVVLTFFFLEKLNSFLQVTKDFAIVTSF